MTASLDILKQYWGYDSFRPLQQDIVESVLAGKDTVALLPTGGGKSVCFQVPGLALGGLTLVVSPLIALMKDQVERLHRMEIPAAFVTSAMEIREVDETLQAAMDGHYRFLYIAPERIRSEMFQLRLPQMPVTLLAVDEAHCISQWGYDFRPAYMEIPLIREHKPRVPVIALTASATLQVRDDIMDKLALRDPVVFQRSFRRDNLRYFVVEEENAAQRILTICQRTKGTGLVYTRTRKRTLGLAKMLQAQGIAAGAYHGGLPASERDRIQQAWIDDELRVIVATNAFGMGIDKPDVRFVVHFNLPFDLESYYQEAGRGGRDGQTALSIAFDNPIDLAEAARWNEERYPTWEEVTRHYDLLCRHYRIPNTGNVNQQHPLDVQQLAKTYGESLRSLFNSLRLLAREGLLYLQEDADDYGYLRIKSPPASVLHYRSTHPSEGRVLELALRSLGGEVYHYEQRFLPGRWAELLEIPAKDLQVLLKRLVQQEMIFYTPPRNQPAIRFIEPRRRLMREDLNWEKYLFLREQSDLRFAEMMKYVKNRELCRSLMIQHYFGEQDFQPCGRCDVCIGRHKTQVEDEEFRQLRKAILERVATQPTTYREIILELGTGTPAQREKVLRYLLDKTTLRATRKGKLELGE